MSHPVLTLNDAANWQLFYRQRYQSPTIAGAGRNRSHAPIVPQMLPPTLNNRIIAAGCNSAVAKPTWNVGGYLTPIVACGSEVLEADLESHRLLLNRARLILIPALAASCKLRYSIPPWFEEISISIYQYVGSETDSTENLIRELQTQISQP